MEQQLVKNLGLEVKPVWFYPQLVEGNPPERWGHSACYWQGKLYIYGGCCAGLHFSDVLVVDPRAMLWKSVSTTGDEPGISDSHSAVLHDDKMVVFGGTNGARKTNKIRVLDLKTMVWSQPATEGPAPAPRESHTATLIKGQQMLVFGGSGEAAGSYLNDVHILDLRSSKWACPDVKGVLPAARDSHTAVVIGNQLVVYGGDCGDRYLGDVDVLDLETFTWSKMNISGSSRPGVRAGHTAMVLNSKMFVFGGVGDRTYYNDLWLLDSGTGTWTKVETENPNPRGRFSHVAVTAEDSVLIYGGCGGDERPLSEFLVLSFKPVYDRQQPRCGSKVSSDKCTVPAGSDDSLVGNCMAAVGKRRRLVSLSPSEVEDGHRFRARNFVSSEQEDLCTLQLPSHHGASSNLIGSELRGIVDGVIKSGYLMTAQLNGQVLRGVLFSAGASPEEVQRDREDNWRELAAASGFGNCHQEDETALTLSLKY